MSRLSPGARLGEWEIVAPIENDGVAQLFLAKRPGAPVDAFVVVTVLDVQAATAGQDTMRQFRHEAHVTSRIAHPGVVGVHDHGIEGGVQYMVAEYVPGCSLRRLVRALRRRRKRLPTPLAVWLVSELARGVHAAHQAKEADGRPLGVVHRNICPKNVLLSFGGDVKLTGFGGALARGAFVSQPSAETNAYRAPEQARGDAIDRTADVYALGTLLWELLTGRPRFGAAEPEMVSERSQPLASELNPNVPTALEHVLETATATFTAERFRTAGQLSRAALDALPAARSVTNQHLAEVLDALFHGELTGEDIHSVAPGDSTPPSDDAPTQSYVPPSMGGDFLAAVAESRSGAPRDNGSADDHAPSLRPRPSFIVLVAREAAGVRVRLADKAAELNQAVSTLSMFGPRLTPTLFVGADARFAYELHAFVTCALCALVQSTETGASLIRILRTESSWTLDGQERSLLDVDRSLCRHRDARTYAAVHQAMHLAEPDAPVGVDDLEMHLDDAMTALVNEKSWVSVDHDKERVVLPMTAWPFLSVFEDHARDNNIGQGPLDTLLAYATGSRYTDLEKALLLRYAVNFSGEG